MTDTTTLGTLEEVVLLRIVTDNPLLCLNRQAYEAQQSLKQQRTSLLSSDSTLQAMLSRIPQINR